MLVELVLIKKLLSKLTHTEGAPSSTPSTVTSVVVPASPEALQTASEFQQQARQYLSGLK
jgi:hypothetical protein